MKANPWWYTDFGNDYENEYFSVLYYDWARQVFGGVYLAPESVNELRAFIAEQLAGEQFEQEEAAYFRRTL